MNEWMRFFSDSEAENIDECCARAAGKSAFKEQADLVA